MNSKTELDALRQRINETDARLIELFSQRMDLVKSIGAIKQNSNIPVLDEGREKIVLERAAALSREEYSGQTSLLMRTLLALSRGYQRATLGLAEPVSLPPARKPAAGSLTCAYQGVPGAWSEHALTQAFPEANAMAVEYFEDVFLAVKEGKARYGVVALENSQTGAIGETYDLLRKYQCYIVGRTTVNIRHNLLALPGTTLGEISRVYSHPQGFRQCRAFLRERSWEQCGCRNTAVAAQTARDDDNPTGKSAAIGSRRAGEINGLAVIAADIMDSRSNKTTFVVIASQPEYDESSDLITVTFSTVHRSGALCESLLPFLAHGINLARIESRPGLSGNYRFFAELEANILDANVRAALEQAARSSEYFDIVGCYRNLDQ